MTRPSTAQREFENAPLGELVLIQAGQSEVVLEGEAMLEDVSAEMLYAMLLSQGEVLSSAPNQTESPQRLLPSEPTMVTCPSTASTIMVFSEADIRTVEQLVKLHDQGLLTAEELAKQIGTISGKKAT